jgi:hypothetical protein
MAPVAIGNAGGSWPGAGRSVAAHRSGGVVYRALDHRPGLTAPMAGAGAAGTRPSGAANPQLAPARAVAAVGVRPTAAARIGQVRSALPLGRWDLISVPAVVTPSR